MGYRVWGMSIEYDVKGVGYRVLGMGYREWGEGCGI